MELDETSFCLDSSRIRVLGQTSTTSHYVWDTFHCIFAGKRCDFADLHYCAVCREVTW
jgi:hypothetical protein